MQFITDDQLKRAAEAASITADEMQQALRSIGVTVQPQAPMELDICVDDDFNRRWDHYRSFMTQHNLVAVWSMYDIDDLADKHPFEGVTHVLYNAGVWSNGSAKQKVEGDTWGDLYKTSNACILRSGDLHHIFIEELVRVGNILHLHTGS